MVRRLPYVAGFLLFFVALTPTRAMDGWLRTRDDGLQASQKSGKPVLVVTIWKDGT